MASSKIFNLLTLSQFLTKLTSAVETFLLRQENV